MKKTTIALIVTQPGPLRNSLLTLLGTLPEIEVVAEARDIASLVKLGREIQPDLVLIEAGLPGDGVSAALRSLNQDSGRACIIVLVETTEQEREARAAGAEVVLFKGYRATSLVALIEQLLAARSRSGRCLSAHGQDSSDEEPGLTCQTSFHRL